MMTILMIILFMWNIINSFLSITAIFALFNNHKEIEAIKSWYPFCEILKIKIPEKEDFDIGEK